MESTNTHLEPTFELCEEKAAKVMRWIAESEDLSKQTFAISLVFEHGVLQENTTAFLRLLLDERFPDKGMQLELNPQEMLELLTKAFTDTYLYLLMPRSFIMDFLSFDSDTVHINVKMLARLRSLLDYPYFPEMIEEWLSISAQRITAEDRKANLKVFLSDVERSIMKYSTPGEIAVFLNPLYEYLGSGSIDRNTLNIYFEDKGLRFPEDNAKNEFSADEVSNMLKEAYHSADVALATKELPAIPEYNTFLQELREIGIVLPPPHPHIPDEETTALPPLDMFIGSKLRKKCIEKIFHENTSEYERAISMLNALEDFSQAQLNLNTLLQIHKVSQDSKVAIRLNDALRLRFGIPSPINSQ